MYECRHTPHGLMFHHFTDAKHPSGQGAITADQLAEILQYVGLSRILTPMAWKEKTLSGKLQPDDICITFDDALLCQFEIAKPVLDSFGFKAFWFVYSGVFEGAADRLEIYRHYRTVKFGDVNRFYDAFFETLLHGEHREAYRKAQSEFAVLDYLKKYPFYTDEDRFFRYMRDMVLGPDGYFRVMDRLIEADASYSRAAASESLWMKNSHLKILKSEGHEIGLHSYSHPTALAQLSEDLQLLEYSKNARHLKSVLGSDSNTMSHPCGSYDRRTLDILRGMGITMGFRSNMDIVDGDILCLPRQDHSNVAIAMGMR